MQFVFCSKAKGNHKISHGYVENEKKRCLKGSIPLQSRRDLIVANGQWKEKKEFVEELKRQWRLMWLERIDDRLKAEGIADKDFNLLFVDRGTIIMATRDYRPLDFAQVLEAHKLARQASEMAPNSTVGGWGKFARETIEKHSSPRRRSYVEPKRVGSTLKKGGKGWLHARL
jgi:hypothetical protein